MAEKKLFIEIQRLVLHGSQKAHYKAKAFTDVLMEYGWEFTVQADSLRNVLLDVIREVDKTPYVLKEVQIYGSFPQHDLTLHEQIVWRTPLEKIEEGTPLLKVNIKKDGRKGDFVAYGYVGEEKLQADYIFRNQNFTLLMEEVGEFCDKNGLPLELGEMDIGEQLLGVLPIQL